MFRPSRPGHARGMQDPFPAGSDVSAGTYKCTSCGYQLDVQSTKHLPPCPECGNGSYDTISSGGAARLPDPARARAAAGPRQLLDVVGDGGRGAACRATEPGAWVGA